MAIQDDFTIDYGAKTVTHTSGATVYTSLSFFQWLAATFAQAGQMDDDYAFLSDTPTVYRWVNGWDMGDETSYQYLKGGSVETSDSSRLFSNLYSIGTQETSTLIYIYQAGSKISSWWPNGNIDVLLKVKHDGAFIDSGNVLVMAREFHKSYDHNYATLSGGGRNPVGINTSPDINNDSIRADVSLYGITWVFAPISRDLNNGNGPQPYDVEIDCNGKTMKEVYEFLKHVTARQSIVDVNGVYGERYLSASEGVYTDVKVAPFGTLAGTTFYGARGVWLTNYAAATFVLTDQNGTIQSPPNYQKVTVTNENLLGCQCFVAEISGGLILKNQYKAASVDVSVVYTQTQLNINKTPQSGNFRVNDDIYYYQSFDGSAFIDVVPNPVGIIADDSIYVPLLDTSSNIDSSTSVYSDNIIYNVNINVRAVVRKYGFKPFTQNTTFTSSGLTVQPVLTDDPQAT